MSTRAFAIGVAVVAVAGLFFAGASTFDFVQHLDRQIHDLHCSFAPGLVEADEKETGCQVTLLSPYSSVMRTAVWGGIPISLAAMGIFALLLYRAIDLAGRPPAERRTTATILLVLTLIPVGASIVMGSIAYSVLEAACKLCIGIYITSGLSLLMALLAWLSARKEGAVTDAAGPPTQAAGPPTQAAGFPVEGGAPPTPAPPAKAASAGALWLTGAGHLFAFTAVPIVGYAAVVPDHGSYIGTCGGLVAPEDNYGVMVALAGSDGGVPTVEVFDPLCPACKGLEERLAASDLRTRLSRRAVMFPLDSECNWMVTRTLHPGACRVSEAVLCAAEHDAVAVDDVIAWAFAEQKSLTETAKSKPEAVTAAAADRFPALKGCLQSAEIKAQLHKSLRWVVANELTVLTPQLFVDGVKLCDEDTDLGLEFTLARMLKMHDEGKLAALAPAPKEEAAGLVPGSEAPARADKPGRRGGKANAKPAGSTKSRDAEPSGGAAAETKTETKTETKADGELPTIEELPPPAEDEPEEG